MLLFVFIKTSDIFFLVEPEVKLMCKAYSNYKNTFSGYKNKCFHFA